MYGNEGMAVYHFTEPCRLNEIALQFTIVMENRVAAIFSSGSAQLKLCAVYLAVYTSVCASEYRLSNNSKLRIIQILSSIFCYLIKSF